MVFLFCLCVVGVIWVAGQFTTNHAFGVQQVAERFGVEANWPAVNEHIYCNVLRIGTRRSWIEDQLLLVGPFENEGTDRYMRIRYTNDIFEMAVGRFYLSFLAADCRTGP